WHELQSLLCALYVTQLTLAYESGSPLFECDIVLEPWCQYDILAEPSLSRVFVSSKQVQQWVDASNQRRKEPLTVETLSVAPAQTLLHLVPDEEHTPAQFARVAVGGTFDHIHGGHKILLTMTALLASESIVVGVTDDSMLTTKKYREYIAPTEKRIQAVEAYIDTVRRGITSQVVPISDPFGPTITDPSIQALVCSRETLKGGDAVNTERAKRDFAPLDLRIIDVISSNSASVDGHDMGALKISSTWIRQYLAEQKA
ncbi:hypothetical protein BCR43DRAFT_408388, partial [Syncephalastrum racemosum]